MNSPNVLTAATNSFEMDYIHFGTGNRTLVIIPGVSMKPVTLSASAVAAQFADMSEQYSIYLFDRKKNISDDYSVQQMAEDTAEAMKLLGLEKAYLFGVSQGGMISQCIAMNHPELVEKLFLSSTLSRQNAVSRSVFDTWMQLAKGDDVEALNHHINTSVYSQEYYNKYAGIFATLEKDGSRQEMDRFYVLAKACREFECYNQLEKISCPVFIAGSKKDRVTAPTGCEEIAAKLGCPLYLYEEYSHAVYDEAPDFHARILNAFL